MRALTAMASLGFLLAVACSSDQEPPGTSATPTAASSVPPPAVSALPTMPAGAGGVSALFTEPQRREADMRVSAPPLPPSPFATWDRASVVLYDTQTMQESNLGRGYVVSFSSDGSKLAMNPAASQAPSGKVRVIELETMASREFDSPAGLASFLDEVHLYLPGPGELSALDIRTGEVVPLSRMTDPSLRAKLEWRATGRGVLTPDGRYRLLRLYDGADDSCRAVPPDKQQRCRAEAFELWHLEEVATGRVVRELRAYRITPAGPGEVLVATSPQCRRDDGSLGWCEDVLRELRADDPPGTFPIEYVKGTSNLFVVDLVSGEAEFVATAAFAANTRVWPANWPLVGNESHVVWTDAYCGQERGHTFVFDRRAKTLTELDAGFWVRFTRGGHLGVGEFGPRAVLDIRSFQWRAVLPQEATDVVQSPDGRYLAVGGVLGHGGLCG